MHLIKQRSKYRTIMWVEKSYIRNTEATMRSLQFNQARFGCTSLYPKAASETADSSTVACRGAGKRLTACSTGKVRGINLARGEMIATLIMHLSQVRATAGVTALQQVHLCMYTGATVRGCKFDSKQTSHRSVQSRSYQNSFVCLRARDVASVQIGQDNSVQSCRRDTVAGLVYAQIECFFRADAAVQVQQSQQAHDRGMDARMDPVEIEAGQPDDVVEAGLYALVQVLSGVRNETLSGSQTTVTNEPLTNVDFSDLFVVPVKAFRAQLLLLKGRDDLRCLRFKRCPGKLYMV